VNNSLVVDGFVNVGRPSGRDTIPVPCEIFVGYVKPHSLPTGNNAFDHPRLVSFMPSTMIQWKNTLTLFSHMTPRREGDPKIFALRKNGIEGYVAETGQSFTLRDDWDYANPGPKGKGYHVNVQLGKEPSRAYCGLREDSKKIAYCGKTDDGKGRSHRKGAKCAHWCGDVLAEKGDLIPFSSNDLALYHDIAKMSGERVHTDGGQGGAEWYVRDVAGARVRYLPKG
jgi:hypothetical protein